jgi:hypothetical protein
MLGLGRKTGHGVAEWPFPFAARPLRQSLQIKQEALFIAPRIGDLRQRSSEAERVQRVGVDAERDHWVAGLDPAIGRTVDLQALRHPAGGQVALQPRNPDIRPQLLKRSSDR